MASAEVGVFGSLIAATVKPYSDSDLVVVDTHKSDRLAIMRNGKYQFDVVV